APSVAGLGFDAFGLTFDRPGLTTGSPGLTPGSPGLTPGAIGGSGARVKGRSLVNRWIETVLEPTGALALHDRRTGERFFDVLRLEDGGDAGDTYTYCPPARDRVVRATGPIKVRRLAAGPLVAALEARQALRGARGGRVGVRFVVMLHADSPTVRCVLEVDNQAAHHRVRARLPTALKGRAAV